MATIYMFGVMEGLKDKKKIFNQANNYWHFLFPRLASYTAFIQRINKLGNAFIGLTDKIIRNGPPEVFAMEYKRLIDSMPIILVHNNRRFKVKVAANIADKNGYCAANKLHYYGVKLHIVGISQPETIPVPDKIGITAAGVSDVKAYQAIMPEILAYEKFAGKAYVGLAGTKTYTPIKRPKDQEFLDAADQLYSTAVLKIRQPIESLFN